MITKELVIAALNYVHHCLGDRWNCCFQQCLFLYWRIPQRTSQWITNRVICKIGDCPKNSESWPWNAWNNNCVVPCQQKCIFDTFLLSVIILTTKEKEDQRSSWASNRLSFALFLYHIQGFLLFLMFFGIVSIATLICIFVVDSFTILLFTVFLYGIGMLLRPSFDSYGGFPKQVVSDEGDITTLTRMHPASEWAQKLIWDESIAPKQGWSPKRSYCFFQAASP